MISTECWPPARESPQAESATFFPVCIGIPMEIRNLDFQKNQVKMRRFQIEKIARHRVEWRQRSAGDARHTNGPPRHLGVSTHFVALTSESLRGRDGGGRSKNRNSCTTSIDFRIMLATCSEISTGGVGHFFPSLHRNSNGNEDSRFPENPSENVSISDRKNREALR